MREEMSYTGGVKPMPIAGRMVRQRERLLGMTDEERAWRAQWLKDQHLAPEEPVPNPEYYKQRYNAFRRFYRWPLDQLENFLTPKIGTDWAYCCRHGISKTFFALMFTYYMVYYFKYNSNDWTRVGGLKVSMSRPVMYRDDPNFPNFQEKTTREFADYGFSKSPL
ncbi:uncharacterized protein ND-B17 [Chelonus insularis]|uniref:uncharacterized protein ND-B17 n=1 Tax=Chelonus insularis TaxID=460826 RepID=UPI00158D83D2|nr:uncharacterized protein LOC118070491 [Chelonus insularis]XP_034945006.1 uncharacterized protein LOC118070491 [Chelonus insularis]XP_034945007.1 uncharacterized protein LOC118070491 [Chelonus insularis]